ELAQSVAVAAPGELEGAGGGQAGGGGDDGGGVARAAVEGGDRRRHHGRPGLRARGAGAGSLRRTWGSPQVVEGGVEGLQRPVEPALDGAGPHAEGGGRGGGRAGE